MAGSLHDADARVGWADAVRDQAPALHALGYALTGSLDDAESLLEAALAGLALDWDGPGDQRWQLTASCRALLAAFERGDRGAVHAPGERVVVTQPPPAHHDPDLERRLPAWLRLHELAPEHRAVLVVEHLAATSGLDRARVLGVHRRDLPERESRAAQAFGPGLADLPAALTAVTGQLPAAVVDAEGAARSAEPRRRRRATWSVVGLVAVLLVVAGLGAAVLTADPPGAPRPPSLDLAPLTPERGPVPLAELPEGAPIDLPYWSSGVLHVDGRTYRTVVPRTIVRAGGTVLVSGAGRAQLVTTEAVAGLPGGITSVRLSPDGRLVAWVAAQEVVASRIEDDGGLGPTVSFDAGELAGPEEVVRVQSVLTDGRVVVQVADTPVGSEVGAGSSGRAVVWTPGEEPVAVQLPPDVLLDFDPVPWPGGISWLVPDLGIVLAEVGDDGAVRPVGELSYGGGTWDPEGRVMAQVYATVPYVLSPFDGGFAPTRLPLPPPADRSWRVVGWESGGSVVVAVAGPGFLGRTLVRCTVPELACERVGGAPDGTAVLTG